MEELGLPYRISYAQNNEDIFLSYFFRNVKKGFYVDVGANDPNDQSVTKYFYEKGWSGINIEPIAALHKKLSNERPRDTNLNIGIADRKAKLKFREYNKYHGLSTMVDTMRSAYDKDKSGDENLKDFTEYEVEVKTLKTVFDEQKVEHIHFLKVDVEGLEYEVLAGNDWAKYRPEVICIEANHLMKDWKSLLLKNNYSLATNDGLNDYYVAAEAPDDVKDFNFVAAILPTSYAPVFSYPVSLAVDAMAERLEAQTKEQADLANHFWNRLNEAEREIDALHLQIEHSKRLKSIIRAFLVKINAIIEEVIYPETRFDVRQVTASSTKVPTEQTAEAQFKAIDEHDKKYLSDIVIRPRRFRYALLVGYRSFRNKIKSTAKVALRTVKKVRS